MRRRWYPWFAMALVIIPGCPALHPWVWGSWVLMSTTIVALVAVVELQANRLDDLNERISNVEMMRRRNTRS